MMLICEAFIRFVRPMVLPKTHHEPNTHLFNVVSLAEYEYSDSFLRPSFFCVLDHSILDV